MLIFVRKRAMKSTLEHLSYTQCLECGDIIEYGSGRLDRKFCSPGCKNRYHNRKKAVSWHRYQEKVGKILENNHEILEHLVNMGVTSIERRSLKQLGYNYDYVTSYHKIGIRNTYSCYDITYEATPSRILHITSLLKDRDDTTEEGAALWERKAD